MWHMLLLVILLWAGVAQAATLGVAWAPSAGTPAPTGYRIYYGTVSGTYTGSLDVVLNLYGQITGLTAGTTYYFIVKAYNAQGESVPSAEVSAVATDTNVLSTQRLFLSAYPR